MSDDSQKMALTIPAGREYALVAGMALSAMGVLAGLDVELLSDLRTVSSECLDCLTHQAGSPRQISVEAWLCKSRLFVTFQSQNRVPGGQPDTLEMEVIRGVLETLMPDVRLLCDRDGVYRIECSMPV